MKINDLSYPHAELRLKATGESCAVSNISIEDKEIVVGISSSSGYYTCHGTYKEVLATINDEYEESPFEGYIETEKIIDDILLLTKIPPRHTEKWDNANCYNLFKDTRRETYPSFFGEICVENLTICIIPYDNTGSQITVRLDSGFEETIIEKQFKVENIDTQQVANFINKLFDCSYLMHEVAQKSKVTI